MSKHLFRSFQFGIRIWNDPGPRLIAVPQSATTTQYKRLLLIITLMVVTISVFTMGCSVLGIANETSMPTAVMSEAEIRQRQTNLTAFANRYHEAWPDVDQTFVNFAEDATFSDPSSGDFLVEGKDRILSLNRTFARYASDMETETTGVYLSTDGAAFSVFWVNLWPPWVAEPSDHPPLSGLELFEFQDELVSRQSIMYLKETGEMIELGCFAENGCDELGVYVDQYLAAWSSRDKRQVASLYATDAVFSDSLLGME